MKTSGVSCETKFGLLVFLGHPSFHPGIMIEMLTTFCLRSSNHPGMTSDGRRCHGESTVILDDDDENNDVKGSDYFSIMT